MEGIDLTGVVDSDFQLNQINFATPRPAGFANFRGAGRGGARLAFLRGSPFSAGRGGVGRGAHPWFECLSPDLCISWLFVFPFTTSVCIYFKL